MKRSRAPNFTTAEVMHLLKLIEKYPIIENKKTDGATTKDKHVAWQNLAAEYNSQTNFSPRTADNLQSCYKNQKIKVKKIYSTEKMAIKAPLLLNAVEEHGQDWDRVAQATEETSEDCKNTFAQLVKAAKKDDSIYKKEINRTGGGPPPHPSCSNSGDTIIEKVKSLIGPSLEGLYTIYDGDAEFMKEQQASVSLDSQITPIELNSQEVVFSPMENLSQVDSERAPEFKRLNVMKGKIEPSLQTMKKVKKKVNVSQSFQALADDKKELVKAQQALAELQIQHQRLLIEIATEKLDFEKKKNILELDFLKQKYEIELNLLKNKQI